MYKINKRSLNGQKDVLVDFQNFVKESDTSASKETHWFALFSRCW